MRASRRRGVALLEVLVAITVLGIAGGAIGGLIREAMAAERFALLEERVLASADRVLIAMSLLGRSELDQRIGRHAVGEFSVEVQRPRPTLYRIAIAPIGAPDVPLLITVVHRAKDDGPTVRRSDGPPDELAQPWPESGGFRQSVRRNRRSRRDRRPVAPSARRGFTLMEVIAALTLLAVVIALAHRVVSVTTKGARALRETRVDLDREANGRRWLNLAFRSLEAGGTAGDFDGRPDRLGFTAWMPTAQGWPERTRLNLGVVDGRLEARPVGATPVILREGVASLALDYLLEPGANTRWVRTWISPVSAPVVVRFRVEIVESGNVSIDTLVLLVGERG
jgi:prepilin-type N-terminal cleavage/methylation domain-containing protein